ncbi:MAG: alpha/beta fold hydrolase BchO [Pseudomonadota bacterium]
MTSHARRLQSLDACERQVFTIPTETVDWHAESIGAGPLIVLLHGTGSSTHSWRTFAPALADRYEVVSFDLPGHARSRLKADHALTLPGMASALADALAVKDWVPSGLVGHSAGAAVCVQLMLDHLPADVPIASLNGAFVPFGGPIGQWFGPLARSLAGNGAVARMIAGRAESPGAVERVLDSTSSRIDDVFLSGYRHLFGQPGHIRATLGMMASWDLWPMRVRLDELTAPTTFFFGERDTTVPPHQASETVVRVSSGTAHSLGPLGHLAHEEDGPGVAAHVHNALTRGAASLTKDQK